MKSSICEVLKIDLLSSYFFNFKVSGFGLGKLCLTFLSSVSPLWEVWFLKGCALMRSGKIFVGFSLLRESLFLLSRSFRIFSPCVPGTGTWKRCADSSARRPDCCWKGFGVVSLFIAQTHTGNLGKLVLSLTKACPQAVQASPKVRGEAEYLKDAQELILSGFLPFSKRHSILVYTLVLKPTVFLPSRQTELLFFSKVSS